MESEPRFSQNTELVLRNAGWFPGRTVSEDQIDLWLVIDWKPLNSCPHGYAKIFPTAWRALNEFGGLTVKPMKPRDNEPFTLDPLLVTRSSTFNYAWHVEEWLFGGTLYPLGMIQFEDAGVEEHCLAMSAEGQVFMLGSSTTLIGACIDDALEGLISRMYGFKNLDVRQNQEDSSVVKKIINKIEVREMMRGEWNY